MMGGARGDAEVLVRDDGRGTRRRRGFGRGSLDLLIL